MPSDVAFTALAWRKATFLSKIFLGPIKIGAITGADRYNPHHG
jgi:hypothetical protein